MSISYQYSKWKITLERHRTAKGNSINSYAIETSDFLNVQMISSDSKQRQWKNEANVLTNIEQRTDTTWTVHELTGKSRKLSTISIEVTLEKNGRKDKKKKRWSLSQKLFVQLPFIARKCMKRGRFCEWNQLQIETVFVCVPSESFWNWAACVKWLLNAVIPIKIQRKSTSNEKEVYFYFITSNEIKIFFE